jgi:cytidine deaminase
MNAIEELFQAAAAARQNAYAPYSRFTVGAAIRSASGAIYAGANVENAAYPVGTCAEAGAIAAMIAAGEQKIAEILIIGESTEPLMPCGACRQRISEFAMPDTKVHSAGPTGVRESVTFGELFPRAFGPSSLG